MAWLSSSWKPASQCAGRVAAQHHGVNLVVEDNAAVIEIGRADNNHTPSTERSAEHFLVPRPSSAASAGEDARGTSSRGTAQALKPGMICSNEPGYYKTGEYGIRIENLVIVRPPDQVSGGEKKMLSFETITLAPIDLNLVEISMLTQAERDWLNAYHADVRTAVTPGLNDADRNWLERSTRPI